ncbi:hypothetical protein FB461_1680 [Rarobacter faecitabidus]|uniref:Uncharacterized protein n=1 Tax=Rarobacter faecitabidus TaxID=13243 RepID=A0A542ZP05_RARFA|nr:hypothetical protein FB461_1680 [Rarobacter faecitabidus]
MFLRGPNDLIAFAAFDRLGTTQVAFDSEPKRNLRLDPIR